MMHMTSLGDRLIATNGTSDSAILPFKAMPLHIDGFLATSSTMLIEDKLLERDKVRVLLLLPLRNSGWGFTSLRETVCTLVIGWLGHIKRRRRRSRIIDICANTNINFFIKSMTSHSRNSSSPVVHASLTADFFAFC